MAPRKYGLTENIMIVFIQNCNPFTLLTVVKNHSPSFSYEINCYFYVLAQPPLTNCLLLSLYNRTFLLSLLANI